MPEHVGQLFTPRFVGTVFLVMRIILPHPEMMEMGLFGTM